MIILLAPFVPHITEELWRAIGREGSVHQQWWPNYDASALVRDEAEIVVQINGKVKDKMVIPTESNREETEKAAMESAKIRQLIEGKQVMKVIVVPKKLVNIVVR